MLAQTLESGPGGFLRNNPLRSKTQKPEDCSSWRPKSDKLVEPSAATMGEGVEIDHKRQRITQLPVIHGLSA